LDIGTVSQTASARAAGRPGTTATANTVQISDVVVDGKSLCSAQCSIQQVVDTVNKQFIGVMEIARPAADPTYDRSVGGDGKGIGSQGGYIAAVQASLPQQYGDQQFNAMSPEESSLLPALRIVVFAYGDGSPNLSREVLDLAGVEVDAEMGIEVLPA